MTDQDSAPEGIGQLFGSFITQNEGALEQDAVQDVEQRVPAGLQSFVDPMLSQIGGQPNGGDDTSENDDSAGSGADDDDSSN